MSTTALSVLIATAGLVLSVCWSMFVAGSRWGQVEGDMRSVSDRLARIEGMFTLQLRDPDERPGGRHVPR